MVGGVLSSCYPFANHDLAHYGMIPVRWFSEIIETIFGDDNGFSVYVKTTEDLGMWVLPHGLLDIDTAI